jgi:hypothetical protein
MMSLWYEHLINPFTRLTLNHIKVCLFYASERFMGLVKHYMIDLHVPRILSSYAQV